MMNRDQIATQILLHLRTASRLCCSQGLPVAWGGMGGNCQKLHFLFDVLPYWNGSELRDLWRMPSHDLSLLLFISVVPPVQTINT